MHIVFIVESFFEISRYTAAKGLYYGKSKLFIACKHGLAAHIRAQRFGYEHAVMLAVKAKVVFKKGYKHTRRCNNGIIKSMRKVFFTVVSLNPYAQSSCLRVAEV